MKRVICKICGELTQTSDAKLCNVCWELKTCVEMIIIKHPNAAVKFLTSALNEAKLTVAGRRGQ